MTPHLNQSPTLKDDDRILELLKVLGDASNSERITMLYMAIDYIYMSTGKLKAQHKALVTKH